MHVHATCMSTDNLHTVTVQRRCPDHRTCPAREVSTYLSDASPSCWTSRNHYGWHISLKRKFTQISRHLFETHKIRLVTVKVVVAVRQHAKQTNKKLAHTAYVPEPRIGARRQARQDHGIDTLKKRGGDRRSGENSPPAQTQQSVMLQK